MKDSTIGKGMRKKWDRIEYDETLEEYCFDGGSEYHLCIGLKLNECDYEMEKLMR